MKRILFLMLCLVTGGWEGWRVVRPIPSADVVTRMPIQQVQTTPNGVQFVTHQAPSRWLV